MRPTDIADRLKRLTTLALLNRGNLGTPSAACVATLTQLRHLNIRSCTGLSSTDLGMFSTLVALQAIDLSYTSISDQVLSQILLKCTRISSLTAGHTNICSVKAIGENLHSLQTLNLNWCRITDLWQLTSLSLLQALHLV